MSAMDKIARKMDWALLREQKSYVWNEAQNDCENEEIYMGLLFLIDAIQDAAVIDGVVTELEVFGELEE